MNRFHPIISPGPMTSRKSALCALAICALLWSVRFVEPASAADASQPQSSTNSAPVVQASQAGHIWHRFLAIDDGTHTLAYVDEAEPARNWTTPLGHTMDMQLLDTNRVLLSVDDGFREYEVSSGRLLKAIMGAGGKAHTVYRPSPERTLLGGEGLTGWKGSCIMVWDEAGQIIERHGFPELTTVRHLRPTPKGFLLAAVGQVVEVDEQWKVAWRAPLAGNLFKAVLLKNGNVLVSSGPGDRFVKEIDRKGAVVREFRGTDLSEGSFTGFDRQANGHLVVANWLGHGPDHNGTVLVEFDQNGKIVWRYGRPHASFVEVRVLGPEMGSD